MCSASLIGPTHSKEAAAGTIRGDFGTDIERNASHGSDAPVEDSYFFDATRGPGRAGLLWPVAAQSSPVFSSSIGSRVSTTPR